MGKYTAIAILLCMSWTSNAQDNTQCGENESFVQAGRECTCEGHCYDRNSPSCMCTSGYLRGLTGNCISAASCNVKPMCGPTQLAVDCGNPCMPTCDDPNRPSCIPDACEPGCICNGNDVLKSNGSNICVPKDQCDSTNKEGGEPTCGGNQEFRQNGTECICKEHCYFKTSPSCMCKDGYVKQNGECVSDEECLRGTNITCRDVEVVVPCMNPCGATCTEPDRPPCKSYACVAGCDCKEGYIWKEATSCIPREQCDDQTGTTTQKTETHHHSRHLPHGHQRGHEHQRHHGHQRLHAHQRHHAHQSDHGLQKHHAHQRQHGHQRHHDYQRHHLNKRFHGHQEHHERE